MPISIEGSVTPSMRPKTGSSVYFVHGMVLTATCVLSSELASKGIRHNSWLLNVHAKLLTLTLLGKNNLRSNGNGFSLWSLILCTTSCSLSVNKMY